MDDRLNEIIERLKSGCTLRVEKNSELNDPIFDKVPAKVWVDYYKEFILNEYKYNTLDDVMRKNGYYHKEYYIEDLAKRIIYMPYAALKYIPVDDLLNIYLNLYDDSYSRSPRSYSNNIKIWIAKLPTKMLEQMT